MKNTILFLTAILFTLTSYGQSPQAFNYQAVVRDGAGNLLTSQSVSFKISIIDSSGSSDYVETHNATSDPFGVVSLAVGNGTPVSGSLATIDWSVGDYFIKVEIDPIGGTNFQTLSTKELLSVPYALYSSVSGVGFQRLILTGNILELSNDTGTIDLTSYLDNTDNQSLSFSTGNGLLSISGGNTVDLISLEDDADPSPTNELQTLSKSGNTLTLTNGGTPIDLSSYLDNTDNQTLSISGNSLTILNGNTVSLPTEVPPGTVIAYAGPVTPNPPAGWLVCNGAEVIRTSFSALFAAIGTSWGSGNGSTTFNLPDMQGMFLRGVDNTAGNDPDKATRTANNSGGNTANNVGSEQTDELKSHSHVMNVDATTQSADQCCSATWRTSGANTTNTLPSGGSETRPKNVYVHFLIKT